MDSEGEPPLALIMASNCCECNCTHCSIKDHSSSSSSKPWFRSVKRKLDEFEEGSYRLVIPDLNFPHVAKVEIGNECVALREMVSNQQKAIDDLLVELDEERNASSSAANEAMSMILRLQREKAEIQMEARQFKRFVEEKMAHDQEEIFAMEDLLYKREQSIQSLTCEVQAYKHRMMSYGLSEAEAEGTVLNRSNTGLEEMNLNINNNSNNSNSNSFLQNIPNENLDVLYEFPTQEYPPLKCSINENLQPYTEEPDDEDENVNDTIDIEKYAFGETPKSRDHLKNLEFRINQLENIPKEKVIIGHSPIQQNKHFRGISTDSASSFFDKNKETGYSSESPKVVGATAKKMDSNNNINNNHNDDVSDDMSDRIYTIDSVHTGVQYHPNKATLSEDFMSTPRESSLVQEEDIIGGDPAGIKKLYMRLQALEADRESMRQALISMRTDKAQLVLLKEIAQHLCKEMSPAANSPVKKRSFIRIFSVFSVFKWALSFLFWRRRARRSKYMFGRTANNVGLLMLLEKGPRFGNWRCLSSTQV